MNAIILAHGSAAETVARHTPNWAAAFDALTFISPSDDPLPGSLPIGLSCRNGTGAIERLLFAVALASHFPVACVMEYDALVFDNAGRWRDYMKDHLGAGGIVRDFLDTTLWCSETFPNEDPPDIFAAPTYGHCPWIATGETWWRLLTAGADYQRGFPDRWLALAALRANVALRGMDGAYSRDRDFDAATARIARLRGAPAIHGVKTEAEYAEIMRPYSSKEEWGAIADKALGKLVSEVFAEEMGHRRTSCPACDGQGCDRCIPDEFSPVDG